MEGQLRTRRIAGDRAATSPKVAMDSEPLSTFTVFPPGTPQAEEQMRASAYSFRNSQDTSSAKNVIKNIEEAFRQGKGVLQEFLSESQELRSNLSNLETKATAEIENVPGEATSALQSLIDSIRSEFVTQQEENLRMEKQLSILKYEKGQIQQQADDQSRRIRGMEDLFNIVEDDAGDELGEGEEIQM